MDHRVTQCPRCGTSFRVTEAHLAVAAGAVRCGSCLHIFNAREHWLEEAPPEPVKAETPLTKRNIENIEIDDDALFDDDTPLFDDDEAPAKASGGTIFNPVDDDFQAIDDSGQDSFSETFLDLNSWEQDSDHSFSDARDDSGSNFGNDSFNKKRDSHEDAKEQADEQEWARKLLEDDEEKIASVINAPARSDIFEEYGDILSEVPEVEETAETADAAELSDEFLDIDTDKPAVRAPAFDLDLHTEEIALQSLHTDRPINAPPRPLFSLEGIEQEPIRLHQFVNEPRWPKVLWGIGLAAMVALAIGQYVYFNFTTLSRGELRPWLTRGCEVFNCVLPPQSDIAQIRTNSLIVRSHPTQRGALAVDAIITNQADFPQVYPQLQLQFTDLNGAPVASRQFSPAEYLSGELKGSHLMPVQQPVHIALELLDPGPRAVNYLLTVVPTTAP
ncbi:MAG: hypothetical protein JWM78_335 [Verrucomicrobiaceae bacterium]|nr:hypothetical protein [Verrucomicrobiaceae bacterium]